MQNNDRLIVTALFCILNVGCLAQSTFPISAANINQNDGRLTLQKIQISDNKATLLRDGDVELSVKDIKWKTSDRIEDILEKERFLTDNKDIYKLIYELNPTIDRLDTIKESQPIKILTIKNTKGVLKEGDFLMIQLDNELRSRIISLSTKLQGSDSVAARQKFQRISEYRSWVSTLSRINQIKSVIVQRSKIIPYSMLLGIVGQVESADAVLSKNRISQEDVAMLNSIQTNMTAYIASITDTKSGDDIPQNFMVEVAIKVVDSSQKPKAGYTIYYSCPGLEGKKNYSIPFRNSASDFVCEARWSFWATKSSEPLPSGTEIKQLEVRRYNKNVIELRIK